MPIEVHVEKRINNRKVVREPDAKSYRDSIVMTVLGAMFLCGIFVYAWQHYQSIQYGYRIEEARKKKDQLMEASKQLRLERSTLRSPQRIDAIARRDLGMTVPAPGQLVTLTADAPLTLPSRQPADVQPAALAAKR